MACDGPGVSPPATDPSVAEGRESRPPPPPPPPMVTAELVLAVMGV